MSSHSIAEQRVFIERGIAATIREQVELLADELGRDVTAAQIDAKVAEWLARPDMQLIIDRALAAHVGAAKLN